MKSISENKGTILIVDDDQAVLVLLQTMLAAADYRVLLAAERSDAIRIVKAKHLHIDLLLLDVNLTGVTGCELAGEIISIRPEIRVLWMSGFVDQGFIRVKLVDRYAGILMKPLRNLDFLAAVQQAIEEGPAAGAARLPVVAQSMSAGAAGAFYALGG